MHAQAKERLFNVVPSNDTAFVLHTELQMKSHTLFSILNRTYTFELYRSIGKQYNNLKLLFEHASYMKEYENPVLCNFFEMRASFHL